MVNLYKEMFVKKIDFEVKNSLVEYLHKDKIKDLD